MLICLYSVGEVVEVGEGVTDYQVGDRVFTIGPGSHAEYSLVTEAFGNIVKLPDDISYEKAIGLGGQALIAIILLEDRHQIQKDGM